MKLFLTKKRTLKTDAETIGYCRENEAECLQIQLMDETLWDKRAYLEFQVNEGEKYTTEALDIVEGFISYRVPNGLLIEHGYLKVQVVIRDDNDLVWKSSIIKLIIEKSICAGEDIVIQYPDFMSEALKVVSECEEITKEATLNEEARKENELTRIANENQRIENEKSRNAAETSRVEAESLRVQNDSVRDKKINDIENTVNEKVTEMDEKYTQFESNVNTTLNGKITEMDTKYSQLEDNIETMIQDAIYDSWEGEY